MKIRFVLIVLLLVIVAGGLVLAAWMQRPGLIEVTPQPGAKNQAVTTPIRFVFSRLMNSESVTSLLHFEPAMNGTFSWDKSTVTFTPEKAWPSGQVIQVQLEAGARAASWLAFPAGGKSWSFSTNSGLLSYLWPADGQAEIYALDPQTGETHQFTFGMNVLDYTVSADGITYYFSASNNQGGADLYQLYRLKLDSSPDQSYQPIKVLQCGADQCRNPVVSEDNQNLAYEYLASPATGAANPTQVWLLNLTTSNTQPVEKSNHESVQPGWSSTGWLAYYDSSASVYKLLKPQTGLLEQLSNQSGQPGIWSPDGASYLAPEISFPQTAGTVEVGISHLIQYAVSNGSKIDISGTAKTEDVEAVYSYAGDLVAFCRKYMDEQHWSFGRQVWVMDSDGANAHAITDEADYNHYDLAWSRDGRRLAYVRFNQAIISDPPELWMVNVDGSNPAQLVIGGYSPTWIP